MLSLQENYLTRGFWGDEAWTSLISQLPYLQMLKTTAADFHPPAYYTIVELWYKIFPTTEVSTRLISLIFYFLTVFVVYKLVSFISTSGVISSTPGESKPTPGVFRFGLSSKRMPGLLGAIVVAVNPIFFTYAFEARNYTMFAFAATGSIYSLIKLLSVLGSQLSDSSQSVNQSISLETDKLVTDKQKSENRQQKTDNWKVWTVLFVIFSTLGIYTHYYMFFILAAQGLYLILFDRKILLRMIGVYTVVAILYLPWMPFLLGQVTSVGQSYWIGTIDNRTHFEALLRILGGENKNFFRPWLFGLAILLILIGLMQHIRQKSFERPYILIWLWATIPFILATLPGLAIDGFKLPFRPIFFWRYLIGASIPLSIVIVYATQKLWQPLKTLSIAMVITLSLIIDFLVWNRNPATFKQIYEDNIVPNIKSEDRLVTVLPSFAEVLYYRNSNGLGNELVVLPEGLVQFSGKSLLDAYVVSGVVKIADTPAGSYFELGPGPSIVKVESQSFDETQDDTE
jgi:uncharacterized membrane protein